MHLNCPCIFDALKAFFPHSLDSKVVLCFACGAAFSFSWMHKWDLFFRQAFLIVSQKIFNSCLGRLNVYSWSLYINILRHNYHSNCFTVFFCFFFESDRLICHGHYIELSFPILDSPSNKPLTMATLRFRNVKNGAVSANLQCLQNKWALSQEGNVVLWQFLHKSDENSACFSACSHARLEC